MQNQDWDRFLFNHFKASVKEEPTKEFHQTSKHQQSFSNLASKHRDFTEFLINWSSV